MNFCEDPYVAALLLVNVEININACDRMEERQSLEFIYAVIISVNIFLQKEIPPIFGHIAFFTSVMLLMLLLT